jgi:hypothetical protein
LAKAQQDLKDCLASNPLVKNPVEVSIIDGMLASAAMPSFFPPVQLTSGQQYVDGGIRSQSPVEAAVALGPDRIITVESSKPGIESTYDHYTMLNTATRSLADIAINEIGRRDTHPPFGPPIADLSLIEPRLDIHTTFSIYPAFVRNRLAYGYMCAADVIAPPANQADAEEARRAADRISVLRYGAARLECWLANKPIPSSMVTLPRIDINDVPGILQTLSDMKIEIKQLVQRREALGAGLPHGDNNWDDPAQWSFGAEVHTWSSGNLEYNATFAKGSAPKSLTAGSSGPVSVTMSNVGTSVWTTVKGVRFSLSTADFGTQEVPLPNDVHPGDSVVFNFQITAPATIGLLPFDGRMRQANGSSFGTGTDFDYIAVVPATEDPKCQDYRDGIKKIDLRIQDWQDLLTGDPRTDAKANKAIATLKAQRADIVAAAESLSCTL